MELLNTDEAAALLGIGRSAIRKQRDRNVAPGALGFRIAGGRVMFLRSDLEAFIAESREAERAERAARAEALEDA